MKFGEKWKIFWTDYASDTYLNGSQVRFHKKDDIEFTNALMPPGTVIKQWYSMTNFQMQKIEPALPIIDGECMYRLTADFETVHDAPLLVRLVFFDRYGVEAGTWTMREKVRDFQCPLKTYSYQMQLINGGAAHFHFHSISIQEIFQESEDASVTKDR